MEPENIESLPAKRKRSVTADPDVSEKENVGKPPSRTRRSSSVRANVEPTTNGRVSTRSRNALPEVPESDDEDEDSPPPVKKSRPSLEPEDMNDDEEGAQAQAERKEGRHSEEE